MDYKNKTVWITGASSGIGEALVYAFSKEQATVIISARNKDKLEEIKSKLPNPDNCIVLPFDLGSPQETEAAADKAIQCVDKIDILINNGGVSQRALSMETSIDIDRKIMEINYFSGIILCKKIVPQMIQNGGGHVLATTSIAGRFGFPLRSAYSASKHAIYGYYETLRAEYIDKNINVTIVCPGRVQTNISKYAIKSNGEMHGEMDPGQAAGVSSEYAAQKVLSAIRKKKVEVLIGKKELLMVHIKRFFPKLFYKLVLKIDPK